MGLYRTMREQHDLASLCAGIMMSEISLEVRQTYNDNSFYFQFHNDTYNITFFPNIASVLGNKEKVEV